MIDVASEYCKDCWAIHLCSLCYMNCYDEKGINIKYRHRHCMANRIAIEKNLILYHEFMEANSKVIEMVDAVALALIPVQEIQVQLFGQ